MSTTVLPTTPRTTNVLKVPELLEKILLHVHVDLKTLLLAQRVDRTFYSVIQSQALQQKLFLQPKVNPEPAELNPLLREFFPVYFNEPERLPSDPDDVEPANDPASMIMMPMFDVIRREPEQLREENSQSRVRKSNKSDAFRRRGASWRRMLVQQPPSYSLGYVYTDLRGKHSAVLKQPEGLRMGTLHDAVYGSACRKLKPCNFAVYYRSPRVGQSVLSLEGDVKDAVEERGVIGQEAGVVLHAVSPDVYDDVVGRHGGCATRGDSFNWDMLKCEEHEDVEFEAKPYSKNPPCPVWYMPEGRCCLLGPCVHSRWN